MQIRLLGPLALKEGGVDLPLGGRKQRAVFALLALNANRVVSADRMIYELWRDMPPARATMTLQSYISRLRGLLYRLAGEAQGPVIVTRSPGWVLQLSGAHIDAMQFADLIAEGRRLADADKHSEASARFRTALSLWAGDPLADLADAPFVTEAADRLHQLRLTATESLLDSELVNGRLADVIEISTQFVGENPFREHAWCSLMIALYRSGRQAEALVAARTLRASLAEGLGLDPAPETRRLEELILRQDISLDTTSLLERIRPEVPRSPPPDAVAQGSDDASSDTSLGVVGRVAALATLDQAIRDAAQGRTRLLVLDGLAGQGKSTVLTVLEDRIAFAGGRALRAAGFGGSPALALWPWVTIVRQLARACPDLLAGNSESSADAVLGLLDPSVPMASPGAGWAATDPALARTRLYRAVIDLLSRAHAEKALTVIIDDAHWLDRESANLLVVAIRELSASGVLFAIGARSDEPAVMAEILSGVANVDRDFVVHVPLPPLEPDDVAAIVRRISEKDPTPAVADAIRQRTGGNPLFVVELVQLLASEHKLNREGVYAVVPREVRDVLRRRIDRLPERTVAILTVAALIVRPVDVGLLGRVTGLDEEAVLDGCEDGVLSALLLDDSDAAGRFVLSHDLVRQILDESLSGARRVRLHAKIGSALQPPGATMATMPPDQIVEIARHFTKAAPIVGPSVAIPYLIAAADDARARTAFQQAEQSLRTALDLAAQLHEVGERLAVKRQIERRLNLLLLMVPAASPLLDEADETPEAVEVRLPLDDESTAEWFATMLYSITSGKNERVLSTAQAALQHDLPNRGAAAAQFMVGAAAFVLGDHDLAEKGFAQTEGLIDTFSASIVPGTFSLRAATFTIRAPMAVIDGDVATADRCLEQARNMAGSSLTDLVSVEYFTAWCAACLGDAARAVRYADACVEVAAKLGEALYGPMASLISGWAAAMQGDPNGLGTASRAHEQYAAAGLKFLDTVQLVLLAEAHAHHGEQNHARELVQQARELASVTGEHTFSPRLAALADRLVAVPT